jgi:DNA-binding transcriptional MerR regulator
LTAVGSILPAVAPILTAAASILTAVASVLTAVCLKMLAVSPIMLAQMSRYSLRELAKAAGASPFAIRHYVKGGLLHPAVRAGQSALFDDSHVVTLKVIASLRAAGHRGQELRTRIADEVARVNAPPPPSAAPLSRAAPPQALPTALPTRRPSARDAVDAAVCAAAEQLDVSPRGLRAALAVVLRRLHEAGVSPEEAAQLVVRAGTDA